MMFYSCDANQDSGSTMSWSPSYFTQCKLEKKWAIIVAVQSTIVSGHPKRGIFKVGEFLKVAQPTLIWTMDCLTTMALYEEELETLLTTHPGEDNDYFIQDNHHICLDQAKNASTGQVQAWPWRTQSMDPIHSVQGPSRTKTVCNTVELVSPYITLACKLKVCIPGSKVVLPWHHFESLFLEPQANFDGWQASKQAPGSTRLLLWSPSVQWVSKSIEFRQNTPCNWLDNLLHRSRSRKRHIE